MIKWYSAASGGTLLATGNSYTTPTLSTTKTYYLEDGNTCKSIRVSVQAIISQTPLAPVVTNGSRCGPGTVLLTASSSATVSWYSSSSGGSALGTGLSFTTPVVNSTTTYYAEANNACISPRSSVQAIVNSIPSPPTTANVSRCGPGIVIINASSPETIYWFTEATGGSPVGTGIFYSTPILTNSTTYYVETGNNCRSSRIPVQAIINTIPSTPFLTSSSYCGPGSVTLSASSSDPVKWFKVASGGSFIGSGLTFTTPSLNTTTTYYAEASNSFCTSSRISIQAVINSIPSVPTAIDNSRCGTGSIELTAAGTGNLYWYSNASGGSPLDSGTTFSSPVISSTTNYYVEANNGICSSSRVIAKAIVNPIPATPNTSDVSRCGPGEVTLSASSPEQIYWYNVPSGGSVLGNGSTYTTNSLNNSTVYYVETGDVCRSERILVNAQIVSKPSPPLLFDSTRCGDGFLILRAVSSVQVNWYYNLTGGSAIYSGLLFTTPLIDTTTIFYADAGLGCNSERVSVHAFVNPLPAVDLGQDTIIIQSGQSVSISAGPGFTTYLWSTSETTSSISVSAQGLYNVQVTDNNGCIGYDEVFVKILTGVNSIIGNDLLKVYPNPASEQITIEMKAPSSKEFRMNLFSVDGKVIRREDVKSINGNFTKTISLIGVSAGVYFLQLENNEYTARVKVLVE